jgi:hypothetical protein
MLPDLRFLICGVLFCFLLFAVTGAGVMLPDARTRIGETPGVSRPMMQRSIVEAPAPAPFDIATVPHRAGGSEQPRDLAGQRAEAAALPEPDPPKADLQKPDLQKPDLVEPDLMLVNPDLEKPDSMKPDLAAADVMGSAGADSAPGSRAPDRPITPDAAAPVQVLPTVIGHDDRSAESAGTQVAVLESLRSPEKPPFPEGQSSPPEQPAADSGELPHVANVPLPQPRPALIGFRKRAHFFHRRRRVFVVVHDLPAQSAPAQGTPGQGAQGAVTQGWQYQSATTSTSAAQAARR